MPDRCLRDPNTLVLYLELIYRKYDGEELVNKAILRIAMRCYYPGEFEKLMTDHGFRIADQFGNYGEGTESVLQFVR